MRTSIFLTLAICFSSVLLTGAQWELITEEDGIKVMRKDVEGRSLPVFKGEGNVNKNLYEILEILRDINKGKEWMHSCKESKPSKPGATENSWFITSPTHLTGR